MVFVNNNIDRAFILSLTLVSLGSYEIKNFTLKSLYTFKLKTPYITDTEFFKEKNKKNALIGSLAPRPVSHFNFHKEESEDGIKERRKRGIYEKGNKESDFDYSDEYKDTVYVFPNSSIKVFNTKTVESTEIPEYEEYLDNETFDNVYPFMFPASEKKTRIGGSLRGPSNSSPSTTDDSSSTSGPSTDQASNGFNSTKNTTNITDIYDESADYSEKDTDYYIRNAFRKDYLLTVALPQAIGITIFLLILFAVLHIPKYCFGFLYKPTDEEEYQTNVASLAREDSHNEHLDEE